MRSWRMANSVFCTRYSQLRLLHPIGVRRRASGLAVRVRSVLPRRHEVFAAARPAVPTPTALEQFFTNFA